MRSKDFDLVSAYGNEKLEIDCSDCKHVFQVKVKDLFNKKAKIFCPRCNADNRVKLSPSTKRKVDKLIKDSKEISEKHKKFFG